MVIRFLLLLLMVCAQAFAIDVSSSIDGASNPEGAPLKGTITVTHNQDETVDPSSFMLGDKPLHAEKVKDVAVDPSSPLLLTIYQFDMDPQTSGVHILPSVSVNVAGKKYSSLMTSYQINKVALMPSTPTGSGSMSAPFLTLEASVNGPTTLYPTQRTHLVYQYFFNDNIDLKEEKLPLLDAKGLVKIGEKDIKDAQQGNISGQQITQEVEASIPGTYTFGPSVITGYAYQQDASGKITARSSLLTSEADPVVVNVLPFPIEGRPMAFNGAVGEFTFSAALQGNNKVDVGNDLSLVLKITGKGNLDSVPLPDVCCQPGFVGLFRVSDLPPSISIKEDTKTAIMSIKPLSSSVTDVPPITFSFFNPSTKQYVSLNSKPLPIVVHATAPVVQKKTESKKTVMGSPPQVSLDLSPATVTGSDLRNLPFGSWWILWIIPFGIAFILYQYFLKNFLQHRRESIRNSSYTMLKAAKRAGGSSPGYFGLLTGALQRRVQEGGLTSSEAVEQWLNRLEEERFSGKTTVDIKALEKDVDGFFAKIPVPNVTPFRDLLLALSPLALFALIICGAFWMQEKYTVDPRLAQANESYSNALEAKALYEKHEGLVEAARLYADLYHEYGPRHGSGNLYMALGNTYGYLGDVPRSLWHMRQAANLRPRDEAVRGNIETLEKALVLPQETNKSWMLSMPEWIQLFALVCAGALLIGSCAVWVRKATLVWLARMAATCVIVAALPLVYYHYFAPLYGTVVTSTNLRGGPAQGFPSIGQEPIGSGSSLEVVGLAGDGSWLQVYTPTGTTGYVPSDSIRL